MNPVTILDLCAASVFSLARADAQHYCDHELHKSGRCECNILRRACYPVYWEGRERRRVLCARTRQLQSVREYILARACENIQKSAVCACSFKQPRARGSISHSLCCPGFCTRVKRFCNFSWLVSAQQDGQTARLCGRASAKTRAFEGVSCLLLVVTNSC